MEKKTIRPEELELNITEESINSQSQEEANLASEIAAPIDDAGNGVCWHCDSHAQ